MLIRSYALLFVPLLACASNDGPGSNDDLGPDSGVDEDPNNLTGDWTGDASSVAGEFIRGGTFPARASFAQSGDTLVGFIDLEQNVATYAEHLGFRAKGTIDDAGNVSLELTDRLCGAGDPVGLCYPNYNAGEPIFRARGRIAANTLTLDSIEKLREEYESGVAVEAPFERLTIARDAGGQIVGTRTGYAHVPRSELFPLPLPLTGTGTMAIAGATPTLTGLTWEGVTYVPVPEGEDPVVLADSFRFDPATGQYWFLQVSSVYSRYVYIGKQYGDELRGAIWSEDVSNPDIYSADAPPIDFTQPNLRSLIGTFNFPAN